MPESSPTKPQLDWAGRVWDASLGRDCEAFYWLASGYPDGARTFGGLTWEQIGGSIQREIAVNLLRLETTLRKAHR
jgi:hypothetical protein